MLAFILRRMKGLGKVVLVWSVLMNHGERAVGIRGKRVAGGRLEPGAIHAGPDRDPCDHPGCHRCGIR